MDESIKLLPTKHYDDVLSYDVLEILQVYQRASRELLITIDCRGRAMSIGIHGSNRQRKELLN